METSKWVLFSSLPLFEKLGFYGPNHMKFLKFSISTLWLYTVEVLNLVLSKKGDFFEALIETWILVDLWEITYWLDKNRRDLSSSFSVWFHFSWEQEEKFVFWKCRKLGQWCTHYWIGVEKPQCYAVFISGFPAILFCFVSQVVSLHTCIDLFCTIHLLALSLALALYDFRIS